MRGKKEKAKVGNYKVKRYIITTYSKPGVWKTVETSSDKTKAERSFLGWSAQLPGGDFRLESPGGRLIKKRYGGIFNIKREQERYKAHQREKRRRRK